jgi:hypothetical protein
MTGALLPYGKYRHLSSFSPKARGTMRGQNMLSMFAVLCATNWQEHPRTTISPSQLALNDMVHRQSPQEVYKMEISL